ncbi:hypothetical protein BI364_08260 [Acidihalobacter yilgarnensis]|uniref:HPP transmembrane region domain-containing protein n=1 Tax=Acidihalobacter yilgarnensis TaxID=2819280 RepID=A0A1D8INA8_9GAMM|nr:HPP family protein [Acidihalobacter yilgarnensis]AOU97956.1 hypothetical protein BI364_08260 [Acidihalobacter yilgarnensis]
MASSEPPQRQRYWAKWRGRGHQTPPRVNASELFWSFIGSVLGIGAVVLCSMWFDGTDRILVIGSLGASSVLVFATPRSPLAQPRNLIGGNLLSALMGVSCCLAFSRWPILAAALAVGLAITVMHLTRTLHPPGGATALVAVIGSPKIHAMGYLFVLFPALLAPLILLLIGLVVNNMASKRIYPEYYW